MSYQLYDKFSAGKPHQSRTAVAAAKRIVVDITSKGVRSSGSISIAFAAAVLEQLDVLIKAGKEAVLLHDEKPGLKATLDFAASQLGLEIVQICATSGDFSDAGKTAGIGSSVEEVLQKGGSLVALQAPPSLAAQVAKACKAQLLIVSGGDGIAAALAGSGIEAVAVEGPGADVLLQVAAGTQTGQLLTQKAADPQAEEARKAAVAARAASRQLQALPTAARQAVLERIAVALENAEDEIMAANAKDVEQSEAAGVEDALMQRLRLKPEKIKQLAKGVRAIAAQEEPIRRPVSRLEVAEGLTLKRVTAPIGVLLIIFEARPDALPQIASLAIRSGNGLMLKGGKEATHSNACLHRLITSALAPDVDPALISLVTSREGVDQLLALDDVIDLVIPRGSNALVKYIQSHTKIPVLGHADGICHIYVDAAADAAAAASICVDSKVDYPAACNAVEKILVHKSWAGDGRLAGLLEKLAAAGVTVHRGDVCTGSAAALDASLPPAPSPRHEYGTLDVTVEVVGDMQEAIDHIHAYGSGHTECIVTEDSAAADDFLRRVDSACINHNASTRFSDGFRFGLGAEVGISTSRIHARGPVGVEGLLTTRWLLQGHGQVVAKDTGITYTHKPLPLDG